MARLLTLVAAFVLVGTTFTGLGGVASASENATVKAVPGVKTLLFEIRSRYSPSKCLDYSAPGPVRLVTCATDPAAADQLWEVVDGSQPGLNKIRSMSGSNCLDVAGAGTANGTPVNLFPCGTQSNQVFAATFVTGNYYNLRAGHSLGKCLDIKNDVPAEGAPLQLWDCLGTGQFNQHFKFVSA